VSRRRTDPEDLSPRDAVRRYIRRRAPDSTESSLEAWKDRLRLWTQWCDSVGIETVGDLTGYDLDEYYELRAGDVSPATLEGEMWTLKMLVRFLGDIEAVDDGLAESVRIPDLDPEDRTDDTKLDTDTAQSLLQHYRESPDLYGSRQHALFELLWTTGARQGGIRALDLRDVYPDEQYVEFRHRPETGTPLKNKRSGERPVGLRPNTVDVLQRYIKHHRRDKLDDHGRQPLITTRLGRVATNTIRGVCYQATEPCLYRDCPHGRNRETCEYTEFNHASKCPSSRSPHQLRTGVVTYLLNQGWPPEDVAERVNSSVDTIEQHYDKADRDERRRRLRERMEDRRRHLVETTEFTEPENDDNTQ